MTLGLEAMLSFSTMHQDEPRKNGGNKMKKGTNFLKITILVLIITIGGSACMAIPEETESSNSPASSKQALASSSAKATKPTVYSDKQIVEAVYADYYKHIKADEITDSAAAAMSRAEELPNRYLGRITSEEDAKEKAEAVWREKDSGILEYTKKIFEKQKQPYLETSFYEKYDVWVVRTRTGGITEDGKSFGLTGVLEIVIRESDGKVLAVG